MRGVPTPANPRAPRRVTSSATTTLVPCVRRAADPPDPYVGIRRGRGGGARPVVRARAPEHRPARVGPVCARSQSRLGREVGPARRATAMRARAYPAETSTYTPNCAPTRRRLREARRAPSRKSAGCSARDSAGDGYVDAQRASRDTPARSRRRKSGNSKTASCGAFAARARPRATPRVSVPTTLERVPAGPQSAFRPPRGSACVVALCRDGIGRNRMPPARGRPAQTGVAASASPQVPRRTRRRQDPKVGTWASVARRAHPPPPSWSVSVGREVRGASAARGCPPANPLVLVPTTPAQSPAGHQSGFPALSGGARACALRRCVEWRTKAPPARGRPAQTGVAASASPQVHRRACRRRDPKVGTWASGARRARPPPPSWSSVRGKRSARRVDRARMPAGDSTRVGPDDARAEPRGSPKWVPRVEWRCARVRPPSIRRLDDTNATRAWPPRTD